MAWFGGIALYFFDMGWWLKTTAVQLTYSFHYIYHTMDLRCNKLSIDTLSYLRNWFQRSQMAEILKLTETRTTISR